MTARAAILARLGGTMSPAQIDAEASALLVAIERPVVDPDAVAATFVARLLEPGVDGGADRDDLARLDAGRVGAPDFQHLGAHAGALAAAVRSVICNRRRST